MEGRRTSIQDREHCRKKFNLWLKSRESPFDVNLSRPIFIEFRRVDHHSQEDDTFFTAKNDLIYVGQELRWIRILKNFNRHFFFHIIFRNYKNFRAFQSLSIPLELNSFEFPNTYLNLQNYLKWLIIPI